eukprot:899362-Pyramimonas_sp.AAC.1
MEVHQLAAAPPRPTRTAETQTPHSRPRPLGPGLGPGVWGLGLGVWAMGSGVWAWGVGSGRARRPGCSRGRVIQRQ